MKMEGETFYEALLKTKALEHWSELMNSNHCRPLLHTIQESYVLAEGSSFKTHHHQCTSKHKLSNQPQLNLQEKNILKTGNSRISPKPEN